MAFRPGRSDTEEDILKAQNQFLSGRLKPAAAAVRVKKDGTSGGKEAAGGKDVVQLEGFPPKLPNVPLGFPSSPKKKSKFKERIAQKKKTEEQLEEDGNAAELLDRHDRHITTVLSQIKEQDTQSMPVMMPVVYERGFPTVLHRGDINKTSSNKHEASKAEQSLFAQQFAKSGGSIFGIPQYKPEIIKLPSGNTEKMDLETESTSDISSINGQVSSSRYAVDHLPSTLVSGQGLKMSHSTSLSETEEAKKIHEENVEKLSAMSEKEILQEQAKLRASLDPALLAFLQTRQKKVKERNKQSDENMKGCEQTQIEVKMDTRHVQFGDVSMKEYEKEDKDLVQKMEDGTLQIGDVALSKNFYHMDKVEGKKLEWTRDCPTPSAVERKGGNQARFDFDGSLVNRASDVPVHLGLHHHGNEPEAAGYTLEELFVLSRSNFLQQRVLALQVLAKVIKQEQLGQFEDQLEASLLPTLLEAGLMFVLRWALDDSSDAVIAGAVQGLAAVLVVPSDKELANKCCICYRGLELPSLQPQSDEKENRKAGNKRKHDDDEEGETSDTEVLKQDVVKGLLQMRLLPRLRYILEVCRPSPPIVLSVLEILTRVTRHSTEAAHEIVRCPRLLDTVFSQFLPSNWKSVEGGVVVDVYGTPLHEALQLIRGICCAGKHMAATLVAKYDLIGRILRYTALHPRDQQLELGGAYALCVESFRTWNICLSYGLACDAFRELYGAFVYHLQSIQCLSPLDLENHLLEVSRLSAILGVVNAALHVAGTTTELQAKINANVSEKKGKDTVEADSPLPRPPLDWSHVAGFSPLIGGCVMKLGNEILSRDRKQVQEGDLTLLSGIFNLLASYYSKLPVQPSFSPVEDLEAVEDLVINLLLPLTTSGMLNQLVQELRDSSMFAENGSLLCSRNIPSLPGYGCQNSQEFPGEKWKLAIESVAFVTSLLRLMTEVTHVHKGMASKFATFVSNKILLDYVKGITESEVEPKCFFIRTELHLQYFLVKLFCHVVQGCGEEHLSDFVSVYHQAALVLFARLQPGDEYYAHDLMSTILFNSRFYPEVKDQLASGVASNLSELSIQSEARPTPPQPTTEDPVVRDRGVLLCEARKNLSAVRSTFIGSFSHMKHALAVSRSLARHQPHEVPSLLLPSCFAEPLLPSDWMFSPIVELHNQVVSAETSTGSMHTWTGLAIPMVMATLQLVLLLEEWRPVTLRHVTMVARVARLMCVFLAGSDLFLDSTVHSYLTALLHIFTRPSSCLARLDFSAPVPGLTSFYDLYASLLSHYAAVSFSDSLFACFLVLPLAQRYESRFRTALWDEHVGALRALSLRPQQLPVPLEHYLYPVEQDEHLLSLYLRALATQSVRQQWSPLFFLLAIHHLNGFIFQRVDPEVTVFINKKLSLLNRVMSVKDEVIRHNIIYYYRPDVQSQNCYELFSNLPADRQLLLRNRSDLEGCREMYAVMHTN